MDLKLHLLDTFTARGSDGVTHKVCVYERLAADPSAPGAVERWEPTGVAEYRLDDGRLVEVAADGRMRIHGSSIELQDERASA